MSRLTVSLRLAACAALLFAYSAGAKAVTSGGAAAKPTPTTTPTPRASGPDGNRRELHVPGSKAKGRVADNADLKKLRSATEPVLVTRVQPTYPEAARKSRIHGVVKLLALIDDKGNVERADPIESPDPSLSAAAVEAVRKWSYKPATDGGKPVSAKLQITVTFKLD